MIKLFALSRFIEVKFWSFPAGERGVKIVDADFITKAPSSCTVHVLFASSDDLIDAMLLCNAVRSINPETKIYANIPYFPYARQDRVCAEGESFSLQVAASIINACNFSSASVDDAHSTVLAAMFQPGFLKNRQQVDCVKDLIDYKDAILVAPDNGAVKKTYRLAKATGCEVIEAGKVRDVNTGEIIKTVLTHVPDTDTIAKCKKLVVVDDICDGGKTFIELAKVLKQFYKPLTLVVTHGVFSKGFGELEQYYSEIKCKNEVFKFKGDYNV